MIWSYEIECASTIPNAGDKFVPGFDHLSGHEGNQE